MITLWEDHHNGDKVQCLIFTIPLNVKNSIISNIINLQNKSKWNDVACLQKTNDMQKISGKSSDEFR